MTRPTNMSATPTILQVGQMNFKGNITPHTWYKQLTLPNGKPHLNAIVILAEIVYWYRPKEDGDAATGQIRGYKRRFHGDLLQRTYDSFAEKFGLSKGQCQDAIKFLEDQGLITRVLRNIKTETGLALNNVLYIDLHVDRLREVTYPDGEQAVSGSEQTPLPTEADTPLDETPDITEITTETTSENTHHQNENRRSESGGEKMEGIRSALEKYPRKDEDRAAKEALALYLMTLVARDFNGQKKYLNGLTGEQMDCLGSWMALLATDTSRRNKLKNTAGFLQSKVKANQYPDQENSYELWQKAVRLVCDGENPRDAIDEAQLELSNERSGSRWRG